MKAYVSGPLTGVQPDPRPLYEFAADVLERRGITAYVPHRATDPVRHPAVTAAAVYARDRLHVLSADVVVAFLAPPSLGVGIELELAAAGLLPVIVLQPAGSVVSRMARGVPTRVFGPHEYATYADVERIIGDGVSIFAGSSSIPMPPVGARVRLLREGAGVTQSQLAEAVGTTTERIQELEEAPPRVSNPSLALLSAIGNVLGHEARSLVPTSAELRWDLDGIVSGLAASANQLQLPFAGESAPVAADVER